MSSFAVADNFTYYLAPPVPSQPLESNLTVDAASITWQTSPYSSEYGAPLIGCVVAAGPTVWLPSVALPTLPTTLSSTASQNCLPYTSTAVYTTQQNTTMTTSLASMNLQPKTVYDFWVMCYNSNGMSAYSILFNSTTSASLPVPTAASNVNCPNGNTVTSSSGTSGGTTGTSTGSGNGASSGAGGKAAWVAGALAAVAGAAMAL